MRKKIQLVIWLLGWLPLMVFADTAPIKFAALNWESGEFTTALLRQIIEKGYGYPTEAVSATGVVAENALIQNDLQVIGEVWDGRSEVVGRAIANGQIRIVGDTLKGGATQGWYIPRYVQTQYPDLKKVTDLPKFAHLFQDPNDPAHARFLNCPTGWACEVFNRRLLDNLKLGFNHVATGTGAALDSEISAYYEQKKPILFYYWQPTALMGKYDFVPLDFPAYDEKCWAELMNAESKNPCVSGFPVSKLTIAVSADFAAKYPDLTAFFQKVQFEPNEFNRQISAMTENQRTGGQQAVDFLQNFAERWQPWVSPEAAARLKNEILGETRAHVFPEWSLETAFNRWLKGVVQHHGESFRRFSLAIQDGLLNPVEHFLLWLSPWWLIAVVAAVAWHGSRRLSFALASAIGLFMIGALGLWAAAMQTVALMIVSITFTVLLGIPLGIGLAKSPRLDRAVMPLLDVMQTMPSFVYLIPVLMLFGLGKVPAMFACLIYAIVPLIRLTVLGIRSINPDLLETAAAFGSHPWQTLVWVVLPQAKPQIMAGINQTVMMSLSMAVLASMIGTAGLGQIILQSIQTLNVGQGLQAGGAIAVLAMIVDRLTQHYGRTSGRI